MDSIDDAMARNKAYLLVGIPAIGFASALVFWLNTTDYFEHGKLLEQTYLAADANNNCKLESDEIAKVMKHAGFFFDVQYTKLRASYSNESIVTIQFKEGKRYAQAELGKSALESYVNKNKPISTCKIRQFPEFRQPSGFVMKP